MDNSEAKTGDQRPMTPGEIAVGLRFNPSGNQDVDTIKSGMARIFDLVERSVPADDGTTETARLRKMRDAALERIIDAQMWAVKVVTVEKPSNPAPSSAQEFQDQHKPQDEASE